MPSFLCNERLLEQPPKPQEGRIWLPLEPMWFGLAFSAAQRAAGK